MAPHLKRSSRQMQPQPPHWLRPSYKYYNSIILYAKGQEKKLQKLYESIKINADNTLSLDEEAFKKADMATVQSLFNGSDSWAGIESVFFSDCSVFFSVPYFA